MIFLFLLSVLPTFTPGPLTLNLVVPKEVVAGPDPVSPFSPLRFALAFARPEVFIWATGAKT